MRITTEDGEQEATCVCLSPSTRGMVIPTFEEYPNHAQGTPSWALPSVRVPNEDGARPPVCGGLVILFMKVRLPAMASCFPCRPVRWPSVTRWPTNKFQRHRHSSSPARRQAASSGSMGRSRVRLEILHLSSWQFSVVLALVSNPPLRHCSPISSEKHSRDCCSALVSRLFLSIS